MYKILPLILVVYLSVNISSFLKFNALYNPLFQQIASSEFTAEDCWSLGFNKANLLCSSCDLLPKFNLDVIK